MAISPYLVFLTCTAILGPLQFGLHLAELNAPSDAMTCKESSISFRRLSNCLTMSQIQFASLSSLFVFGGFVGAMTAGSLSTKHGKLFVMRIGSVLFIVGSTIITLANTVLTMQIGRIIVGLASGAATVTVPMYLAHLAPVGRKGFFGSLTQVAINIGILITQSTGFFLSQAFYWRGIMLVGAVIATIHCLCLSFAVDAEVLSTYHKAEEDVDRPRDLEEPLLTRQTINEPHDASPPSMFTMLTHVQYRPALVAVVGVLLAQQFTGINGIMMYSVSLLKGVLPVSSALLTIVISFFNLLSTVALSHLPDKIGRKPTLLISIGGMGTMSALLGLSLLFNLQYISALSVILFVVFFAGGLGPVPFSMASEMVDKPAVGALQSWGLGASYFGTFLVAQFFPIFNTYLNQTFGGSGWIFFFFAGMAVLSAIFVFLRVPETKGKTVNEVWGRVERLD